MRIDNFCSLELSNRYMVESLHGRIVTLSNYFYKKSSRIGVKLSINRAIGDTMRIECFIPEGI